MNSFHNLTINIWKKMNIIKHTIHEFYGVSLFLEFTSLYPASSVSVHHSYQLSQLECLHNSCLVSDSRLMLSCSVPTFPSSLSFSSDIQHFFNPLTITSGYIGCHGLDPWAQLFYTGPFYCPCGDRICPLPRAI